MDVDDWDDEEAFLHIGPEPSSAGLGLLNFAGRAIGVRYDETRAFASTDVVYR